MQTEDLPNKPESLDAVTCDKCGHTQNHHSHSLSQGLVSGLRKFAEASRGNPLNLKEAGLDRNEWDNFQKLKYWGLVTPTKAKSGIWTVTELGFQFLAGLVALRKTKITLNGKVVFNHNESITINQIKVQPYFYKREDYVAGMNPTVTPSAKPE
jgi:hypothetical protein